MKKTTLVITIALLLVAAFVLAENFEVKRYGTFSGGTGRWTNDIGRVTLKYVAVKSGVTNSTTFTVDVVASDMTVRLDSLTDTVAYASNTTPTEVSYPLEHGESVLITSTDSVSTNTYVIVVADKQP